MQRDGLFSSIISVKLTVMMIHSNTRGGGGGGHMSFNIQTSRFGQVLEFLG